MKKKSLFILFLIVVFGCNAQSVKLSITAGSLHQLLPVSQRQTVKQLFLTGTIDARDFKTLRDSMPALQFIDLNRTQVLPYRGQLGTLAEETSYLGDVIPKQAFVANTNIQTLYLPQNIVAIERAAFAGCIALQNIYIPNSVAKIGGRAFENCRELTYLIIPDAVRAIEDGTFAACHKLDSVSLSPKITVFGSSAFELCERLQSITWSDSVTDIRINAFYNCKSLKSIHLPASLQKIGMYAFYDCNSVKQISTQNPVPLANGNLNDKAFYGINPDSCTLSVPMSTAAAYKKAPQWNVFVHCVEQFEFNVSPQSIKASGEASIDTLFITSNEGWSVAVNKPWVHLSKKKGRLNDMLIVRIAENNSIVRTANIQISDSLGAIKTITITQAVVPLRIDLQAGTLASRLNDSLLTTTTHIIISGTIDARDFKTMRDRMPVLQIIDVSQTNVVGYEGAEGTAGILGIDTSFYPPNTIPLGALLGDSAVHYFIMPQNINAIHDNAFEGCSHLLELFVPESVTYIGSWAFSNCRSLKKLTCLNPEPLTDTAIGVNVFNQSHTGTCTLFVPYRSLPKYLFALQWRSFLNIRPLPGFILTPTAVSISGKAASLVALYISANEPWTASCDQPWMKLDKWGGERTDSISIIVPRNVSHPRKCTVTVSAAGVPSQSVTITQGTVPLVVYSQAGMLSQLISREDLASVLNLVVIGTIDARDFKTMRDSMPEVQTINLVDAQIVEYTGTNGTDTLSGRTTSYPADVVPTCALFHKKTLCLIELPAATKQIGSYSFAACSSLKQCSIPFSTSLIEAYSFTNCDSLPSVTISSSVARVEEGAFQHCAGLKSLYICSSVTALGNRAFAQCSALRSITVEHTQPIVAPNMGTQIFDGVKYDSCTLHIPYRTTDLYKAVDQWKEFIRSQEDEEYTIVLYPNPTSDQFAVMCEGQFEITIFNVAGERVLQQMASRTEYISIASFPHGLFFVRVDCPFARTFHKLVKN